MLVVLLLLSLAAESRVRAVWRSVSVLLKRVAVVEDCGGVWRCVLSGRRVCRSRSASAWPEWCAFVL
eukprot:scaffold148560_cov22-Tisochrysis_lutea.AAC.1